MGSETLPLALPVGVIVIIIEAGLTDPDDLWVGRLGDQQVGMDVRMEIGLVGMDPYRRHDVIFLFGQADHFVPFAGPSGDVQHLGNAGAASAVEYGLLVLDQAFVVQVAMAIYEHGGRSSAWRLASTASAQGSAPALRFSAAMQPMR